MDKHQLKTSTIYCGDNLQMLKDVPDESVDLIYIDPPFNSNRHYETFWHNTQEKRDRFGDADAYIRYMRPRIVEMYRVLKKTGSFYYHCDWHASHYVKIMLDQIFNFNNFRNEIVWHYRRWSAAANFFQRMHDTIFWYSKSDKYTFNKILQPYSKPEWVEDTVRGFIDGKLVRLKDEQRNYIKRKKENKGVLMHDVWDDINFIAPTSKERLGYPTQKPIALLERIIEANSNKGDIVLDAFCGCGTALIASQKLGRKWVGIDISPTACRVMSQRLWDTFKLKESVDFFVNDLPKTEEELRIMPPFEFQNWAVIALGGIPNRIKSGDYGIDGKLYPIEQERRKQEGKDLFGDIDIYYPIQVKQRDKAGRPDIDSFETAMRRDKRNKGYFISFDFSEDAVKEIKRLDKEGDLEIIPITVRELVKLKK